jgi:ribonuclease HI
MTNKYKIFTDGGSRGNPGPAAIGVVIFDLENDNKLHEISKCLGSATNNIAEYSAVEAAIDWVKEQSDHAVVDFYLDSELVQRQLIGQYKVKDPSLRQIFLRIREKVIALHGPITFTHVKREFNADADALLNKALDKPDDI